MSELEYPILYPTQCPHPPDARQVIKEINPGTKQWIGFLERVEDRSPTSTVIRCGLCHYEFSRRKDYPMRAIWA